MLEFLEPFIAAPVLPATALLGLMVAWSLFTLGLGMGHDMGSNWHFHWHDPTAGQVGGTGHGAGIHHLLSETLGDAFNWLIVAPTRWLNVTTIPFLLWIGVFSITWWTSSLLWWLVLDEWLLPRSGGLVTSLLVLRNVTCALPLTKLFTQPMRAWFADSGHLDSKTLIGSEAEICSYDATPTNGQAKYRTGSAPLLLNVRTDGPHLLKGTRVWITHYDPRTRIYLVSPTTTDSPTSPQGTSQ